MAQATSSCPSAKRRRKVLSVEDKANCSSYTLITKHYGIGKSTEGDIKRNKSKKYLQRTQDMSMTKASHKSDEICRIQGVG